MKQSRIRKVILFLPLIFVLISLSGCWSSHELEELNIGVGLAIDAADKTAPEKGFQKKMGAYPKKDVITLTSQLINTKASGKESKGGAQQKSYNNISETGDSYHQLVREVALRTDRPIIFHHMKVIVIAADIVRKYGLDQLLDFYFRDNEMRPSCMVFICKGIAKDTFETKKTGEIPAIQLLGILDNSYRTTRIIPPLSLSKIESKITSGSSYLIQNVISADGEIKFSGAAIINGKTNKLLGFLNEEDLDGISWITGKGSGGIIKGFDKKKGQIIMYEAKSMKSKITPFVKNGRITSFNVDIQSEGRLSENWNGLGTSFDGQLGKRVESTIEEEVKKLMKSTVEKMQRKFHADVAGFGNQVRIDYPRLWAKEKTNWDQLFSEIPIKYSVHLTITDFGAASLHQ